jgi:hypothetical protein
MPGEAAAVLSDVAAVFGPGCAVLRRRGAARRTLDLEGLVAFEALKVETPAQGALPGLGEQARPRRDRRARRNGGLHRG